MYWEAIVDKGLLSKIRDDHAEAFKKLAEGPNEDNATDPVQAYAHALEKALYDKIREVENLKAKLNLAQSRVRRMIR